MRLVGGFATDSGKHKVQRHDLPITLPRTLHESCYGTLSATGPEQGVSAECAPLKTLQANRLSCERVNRNEIAANCNTRHRVIFLLDLPRTHRMRRGRVFQLHLPPSRV